MPSIFETQEKELGSADPRGGAAVELDWQAGFEDHSAPMALLDPDTCRIVEANRAAARLYGGTREQLVAMNPHAAGAIPADTVRILMGGVRPDHPVVHVTHTVAGGRQLELDLHGGPVRAGGRRLLLIIVHDRTEQRKSERGLERMIRLHGMLADSNELLASHPTRQALFDEATKIAVRRAGFTFAWVGVAQPGTNDVVPVARAGTDHGYIDDVAASMDPDRRGDGPTGRAMRHGEPVVVNDFRHAPSTAPWHAAALQCGVRSSAAFPVRERGRIVGSFNVYSAEEGFFTTEAVSTLVETAGVISLGLDQIAREEERVALVRSLETAEKRWRFALDAAGHGVWEWNTATGHVFHSTKWKAMLGYEADDDEGDLFTQWVDRVHPDDLPQAQAALERHLTGECAIYRSEHRVRCKDGSYRYVADQGTSISRHPDGRPLVVTGTLTDITDRKRVENALREAQRIARLGSWEIAFTDGGMIWSDEFYDIVGIAPGREFRTPEQAMHALVHPDDEARTKAWLGTLMSGIDPGEVEVRLRRTNGEVRHVAVKAELIRDADERPVRAQGTMLDITERVHADEALRVRGAALDAAATAIIITKRDGTIVWANPAFSSMTGYTLAEAVGHNPRELVKSGVHEAEFYAQFWRLLLSGKPWRGEITNRRKDGSLYPEELAVTPVANDRGEITHFIGIKRDLTADKELQAQYLQAQKMDSVGRLAAGISHDFNNLLTVITSLADLGAGRLIDGDPARADLLDILDAGRRASALTRQLLAFSRKQIMSAEVINLGSLVTNLAQMLRRVIGEDIRLEVASVADLGNVRADPAQLEQVILNLVVNARDAMPTGGVLRIDTANVELDADFAERHRSVVPGSYVRLSVADSGTGMDDATRQRAFEPFFTTKGAGKGTGLGLATVYGIVKQSGGSVWIDSAVGKGSTFTIYLPRTLAPKSTHAAQPASHTRGTESILVVEDESALRRIAHRILSADGYQVRTAASGTEALGMLDADPTPLDLLITDVVMPGMSGQDLAARVFASGKSPKVLFTSGYTDDEVLRRGVLDRETQFLPKPYTPRDLAEKVREVLDEATPPPVASQS